MTRQRDYWRRARKVDADPTWREQAACRGMGPDLFFGDRSDAALKVCAGCEVRKQCSMAAAVNRETEGVWGGKRRHEPRPRVEKVSDDEVADRVLALFQKLARELRGEAA